MPGNNGANDQLLLQAIHNKTLSEEILNQSVERIYVKYLNLWITENLLVMIKKPSSISSQNCH